MVAAHKTPRPASVQLTIDLLFVILVSLINSQMYTTFNSAHVLSFNCIPHDRHSRVLSIRIPAYCSVDATRLSGGLVSLGAALCASLTHLPLKGLPTRYLLIHLQAHYLSPPPPLPLLLATIFVWNYALIRVTGTHLALSISLCPFSCLLSHGNRNFDGRVWKSHFARRSYKSRAHLNRNTEAVGHSWTPRYIDRDLLCKVPSILQWTPSINILDVSLCQMSNLRHLSAWVILHQIFE